MDKSQAKSFLHSLHQHGLAVLPQLTDAAVLDAMRSECTALLEQAESAQFRHENDPIATSVAEQMGCIFQILPELAQAQSNYRARTDPKTYWALRTTWPYTPAVAAFLQSQPLLQLLQETFSSESVLLYNEQYIMKPPRSSRSSFAWHYDSKWCSREQGVRYSPYLSLWVALDDMTIENGCLVVLPAARQAGSGSSQTAREADSDCQQTANSQLEAQHTGKLSNSTAGMADQQQPSCSCSLKAAMQQPVQYISAYNAEKLQAAMQMQQAKCGCCDTPITAGASQLGSLPESSGSGDSVVRGEEFAGPLGLLMPAGTAVLFWDNLWHCSGPNNSRYTRSAYMAQFSSKPLVYEDTGHPVGLAICLSGP